MSLCQATHNANKGSGQSLLGSTERIIWITTINRPTMCLSPSHTVALARALVLLFSYYELFVVIYYSLQSTYQSEVKQNFGHRLQ